MNLYYLIKIYIIIYLQTFDFSKNKEFYIYSTNKDYHSIKYIDDNYFYNKNGMRMNKLEEDIKYDWVMKRRMNYLENISPIELFLNKNKIINYSKFRRKND